MKWRTEKLPHLYYGGDYNPEQWSEDVWQDDMRLMKKAGVNLVSIGIFSWAMLQPDKDTYEFGWLDKLMDLLAENGIYADLATATASPPAWMAREFPDSLAVDRYGNPYTPGGRQHYSPTSRVYREYAQKLVRRLAVRYRNHPALAMWHVNNEYACHVQEDYSEQTKRDFREWLKKRYGSLDELNRALGNELLEPALLRLGGNRTAAKSAHFCESRTDAGLQALYVRCLAGMLFGRTQHFEGNHAGHSGHDEFHGGLQAAGLF